MKKIATYFLIAVGSALISSCTEYRDADVRVVVDFRSESQNEAFRHEVVLFGAQEGFSVSDTSDDLRQQFAVAGRDDEADAISISLARENHLEALVSNNGMKSNEAVIGFFPGKNVRRSRNSMSDMIKYLGEKWDLRVLPPIER